MALQGTIDTFELTEVIRMLTAGSKTGRLGLSGDRGSGSIWFVEGQVVASETDAVAITGDHASVLFQLLRFETGSFVFDQDAEPSDPSTPVDSEPVIAEATERLAEWREVSAVVPSLRHRVSLRAELGRSDVVLDKARWRALATVSGGTTVGDLGTSLEQDELEVSRTVKDLSELGVVEVSESEESDEDQLTLAEGARIDGDRVAAVDGFEPAADAIDIDPILGLDDVDDVDVEVASTSLDGAEAEPDEADRGARDQLDALASGFGLVDDEPLVSVPNPGDGFNGLQLDEPEPLAGAIVDDPGSFPIEEAEAAGEATTPLFAHDAGGGPVTGSASSSAAAPGEAAEVARQLANLSPEAARAVAAAARATTEEEREAALAQVAEEGDEPLAPDLLRSFLASVKS